MEFDDMDDDAAGPSRVASPGQTIASYAAVLRGHGTYIDNDDVVASVTGLVDRVNKLITVKTLRSRYNPEVGDLVVGRISDVWNKRWRVELNARLDGILMLSSVNLPGGVQRRKLEADELQMRSFFEEGDLLVAEVQSLFADGAPSLHTRSLKFGKLRNGQLVSVSSTLIRRLKSHFFSMPCGVDVILGMNGYIWVSKHVQQNMQVGEEGFDAEGVYSNVNDPIDSATHTAIARVSALILSLARSSIPLTDTLLNDAYDWTVEQNVEVTQLLNEDVSEAMILALSSGAVRAM
ncbi:hypothetical protein DL93DRAFT_2062391 [Clavulina sp. PMI_390]|nr:hypothetical protein DL93DRAFT_2062391 [Clavulina sp. PMI_390]